VISRKVPPLLPFLPLLCWLLLRAPLSRLFDFVLPFPSLVGTPIQGASPPRPVLQPTLPARGFPLDFLSVQHPRNVTFFPLSLKYIEHRPLSKLPPLDAEAFLSE